MGHSADHAAGRGGPPASSRRTLLERVLYGLWGVIAGALGAPAAAYLASPPRSGGAAEWVDAAALTEIPADVPAEIIFERKRADGWKTVVEKTAAWMVKQSDHEVIAFAPQCTHLGCAYGWDRARRTFVCPCHASEFAPDGRVLSGPAPRPLDRFAVKIENRRIWVGPVRRSGEA